MAHCLKTKKGYSTECLVFNENQVALRTLQFKINWKENGLKF